MPLLLCDSGWRQRLLSQMSKTIADATAISVVMTGAASCETVNNDDDWESWILEKENNINDE